MQARRLKWAITQLRKWSQSSFLSRGREQILVSEVSQLPFHINSWTCRCEALPAFGAAQSGVHVSVSAKACALHLPIEITTHLYKGLPCASRECRLRLGVFGSWSRIRVHSCPSPLLSGRWILKNLCVAAVAKVSGRSRRSCRSRSMSREVMPATSFCKGILFCFFRMQTSSRGRL